MRLLWILEHVFVPQIMDESERGVAVRRTLATTELRRADLWSQVVLGHELEGEYQRIRMTAWELAMSSYATDEARNILQLCAELIAAAKAEAEQERLNET